jgi:hypothetical protein
MTSVLGGNSFWKSAPVFGTAIGLFFYATLFGILAVLVTRKQSAAPGNLREDKTKPQGR